MNIEQIVDLYICSKFENEVENELKEFIYPWLNTQNLLIWMEIIFEIKKWCLMLYVTLIKKVFVIYPWIENGQWI